jgi:hypothetical protein
MVEIWLDGLDMVYFMRLFSFVLLEYMRMVLMLAVTGNFIFRRHCADKVAKLCGWPFTAILIQAYKRTVLYFTALWIFSTFLPFTDY